MRDMKVTSNEEAKKAGWDIVVPFPGELIGKAVFEDDTNRHDKMRIMKSTKRFQVPGGWIYNTSTEIHKGERVSVAEALVFVPSPGPSGMGGDTRKP